MSDNIIVLLAGGGTAGHIEPALAVGEALRIRHGATLHALGTEKGLDGSIIPARGVDLHMIDPVPIPRKKPLKLLAMPFKIAKSVLQARQVIKRTNAEVVFGTGGYVAAPAYLAAKSTGTPFYVLETNALAGMANKLGVKLGGTGFNAVANSGMPGEVVGIPVRPGLGEDPNGDKAERAREQFGLDSDRPVLLVTGGSQGAVSINAALKDARADIIAAGWQILHAYGKKNDPFEPMEHYHALPYIEDMPAALAVSEGSVCRSGAMTVAEVTASRIPAIYIPLPHGNGEQARNCTEVVARGGAILIDDQDLTPQGLTAAVEKLRTSGDAMRVALRTAKSGTVAEDLADRIASDLNKN